MGADLLQSVQCLAPVGRADGPRAFLHPHVLAALRVCTIQRCGQEHRPLCCGAIDARSGVQWRN